MSLRNNKIIGISRIRNESLIIKDTLDHLENFLDGVIIYDDCSTDDTLKIIKDHGLVLEVIRGNRWESDPTLRAIAEGTHRQMVYRKALEYSPDWIFCFDGDEFVELSEDLDLNDSSKLCYYFKLFDFYITKDDIGSFPLQRKYIGPEFRKIPMLFHHSIKLEFKARVPKGIPTAYFGGNVRHYGKAISIKEWENTCDYYINHLNEKQPGNSTISEKWKKRKGKAIHHRSDFNSGLIKWEEKELKGFELNEEELLQLNRPLNILLATSRLSRLSGCETYTYAMAEELKSRNIHSIEYFTFEKGFVSDKMEKELKVRFMSRRKYDLILANHNSTVNFLKGKGFIIQTCHGIFPDLEQPSKYADAFVGISEEVCDHITKKGFLNTRIYNGINLNRFHNQNPISQDLKSILSLCHSKKANVMIKEICKELNLIYHEASKYEMPIWEVEEKINQADLIIGLGRSAYEAMSCGRPVLVFDDRGYFPSYGDGYIGDNLIYSLKNNCSGRYFKKEFTRATLIKEINKYNHKDSTFFRNFAVRELDIEKNINKYLNYYYNSLKQSEKQIDLSKWIRSSRVFLNAQVSRLKSSING